MNAIRMTTAVAVAAAVVSISEARAQTAQPEKEGYFTQHLDAPVKALEFSMGTGYTQGFGSLQKGVGLGEVITPGFAVNAGIGYRINARWAVGIVGQFQEFNAERATSARGLLGGIAATYHVLPYQRTDPWLRLGSGYRLLWENNDTTAASVLSHGFELARLDVGVDLRFHQDVAVAPVIGAGLTLPLWQGAPGGAQHAISDPRVATFVFAGIEARFDATGKHDSGKRSEPVAQTQITQAKLPPPAPPPKAPPSDETKMVSPSIAIAEDVLAACNIHLDNIDKAPKFEFDKSQLLPADYDVLRLVGDCFTTGPLAGANLRLVGRADPRGTTQYNDALGMRRATSVGDFLERLGVEGARIEKISRGERDAIGTDEYTWAIDRRVDVMLAH